MENIVDSIYHFIVSAKESLLVTDSYLATVILFLCIVSIIFNKNSLTLLLIIMGFICVQTFTVNIISIGELIIISTLSAISIFKKKPKDLDIIIDEIGK